MSVVDTASQLSQKVASAQEEVSGICYLSNVASADALPRLSHSDWVIIIYGISAFHKVDVCQDSEEQLLWCIVSSIGSNCNIHRYFMHIITTAQYSILKSKYAITYRIKHKICNQ